MLEAFGNAFTQGWRTCHVNAWALNSQLSAGAPFLPHDEISNIGKHTQRLNTFTFAVSLKLSGPWNCRSQILHDQIVNRVNAGARFTYVGQAPNTASGCTECCCVLCGACLNLVHPYFGSGGVFSPGMVEIPDGRTKYFWLPVGTHAELGLLSGSPEAAYMCTAETIHLG